MKIDQFYKDFAHLEHLLFLSGNVTLEISPTETPLEVALVGDPGRLFRIPRVATDALEVASWQRLKIGRKFKFSNIASSVSRIIALSSHSVVCLSVHKRHTPPLSPLYMIF